MGAGIVAAGIAAAVSIKAGKGTFAAGLQWTAKYVFWNVVRVSLHWVYC
jgi:hypothetical protein